MSGIFSRNEFYWGEEFQKYLANRHVAVFGLGGVGAFCAEALARSGVGHLSIVDFDVVSESNLNRQLPALFSAIGEKKTEVLRKRLLDINPEVKVHVFDTFESEKNIGDIFSERYDFVADAIDSFRSKIDLMEYCFKNGISFVQSAGAGNRLDPTKLYISDISEIKPKNCPFVSRMLSMLRNKGITSGITVVTSREKPKSLKKVFSEEKIVLDDGEIIEMKKFTPSSTPFVPAVAGYLMAYFIVESFLINFKNE